MTGFEISQVRPSEGTLIAHQSTERHSLQNALDLAKALRACDPADFLVRCADVSRLPGGSRIRIPRNPGRGAGLLRLSQV